VASFPEGARVLLRNKPGNLAFEVCLRPGTGPASLSMGRPIRIVTPTAAVCATLMIAAVGYSAAPADEGRVAFNNSCRTCHSLKAGDNRLGPSLHGIFGAKAGKSTGYAYSQSLRQSGVTWDEATLERWIENPEAVVPNNNMKPYSGLADATVRKKILDFLKKNNDAS